MSIKLLAQDLYRYQREVWKLEKELDALPYEKRVEVENTLRRVKSERDFLRRALDGRIGR